MKLLLIASTSFMVALSGALVPGPLFTITVSESARRGFRAGPLIILGHGLLELAIVLLLVSGVTPLLTGEMTRRMIGVIGGTALAIMGLVTIRDAARVKLDLSSQEGGRGGMHPVLSGLVGSLSNPYWVIWWATIGLGYLVSSLSFGVAGVLAFFVGHISADLCWYSIVSFAVARGRRIMGVKGYRYLLYACGAFLIVFGGWFVTAG